LEKQGRVDFPSMVYPLPAVAAADRPLPTVLPLSASLPLADRVSRAWI